MIVSFFQSLLLIQPLKVRRCMLAFHSHTVRYQFHHCVLSVLNVRLTLYDGNVLNVCSCLSPQVLFLAIFFALVIKKVDEDDFQNVAIIRTSRNLGKEYVPILSASNRKKMFKVLYIN